MKALADAAAPSLKKARKGRAQLADPQHASDGSSDTAKGAPLSVALPEQAAGAPGRMDIIGSPWYGRTLVGPVQAVTAPAVWGCACAVVSGRRQRQGQGAGFGCLPNAGKPG